MENIILKNLEREYFTLCRKENPTAEDDKQMGVLEDAIRREKNLPRPPKLVRLFGITGKMKHGKDTFFSFVQELCPGAVRVSFADALKNEVAKACNVTVDFINQNKDVFRPVLQWWGTEFRRGLYGNNYWLDRLDDTIRALPDNSTVFVTDVRFLNEAEFVRSMGGSIVKIIRVGHVEADHSQHQSELELEKIIADSRLCAASVSELKSVAKMWWEKQKQ